MADRPHVGPDPVEAKPNHVREKTYREPNPPPQAEKELERLPEKTTEEKVRTEMHEAVDKVKDKL